MVNKRLLIKNILANNDECTFFDKKEALDLRSEKGKAKLLKHICALSNSNPENDSFIIVGVSNSNEMRGCEFVDDSHIQNLVNSALILPPRVSYENIAFPEIDNEKSIGLLTISPSAGTVTFSRNVGPIGRGTAFHRLGSTSEPVSSTVNHDTKNKEIVDGLYKYSRNSIKGLLDGVIQFYKMWDKEYDPQHVVFKDQFAVCWSGWKNGDFHSEVDVQIVNEGVRLFFSAIYEVKIYISDDEFRVDEYRILGIDEDCTWRPFESTSVRFENNGTYKISKKNIFVPPVYSKDKVKALYERTKAFEKKIREGHKMDAEDPPFWEGIGNYYLVCYFNGIKEARDDLHSCIDYLDGVAAQWHRECEEILESYEKSLSIGNENSA